VSQILSQDEVDALLKGLDTGEIETEREPIEPELEYQAYDWTAQGRNLKGTMPLLVVITGRFAQKLGQALSASLGKIVEVDAGPLKLTKYEEFQRSLPIPTSLHLFRTEPLRGVGMLVIESRLVFNLVETFFGGTGTGSAKVEGRDFTPIERKIIHKVVTMAMTGLKEAWAEVSPIKAEVFRSETNPLGVNAFPPSESLITTKFEVELSKPAGSIVICLPYSSLQPVREKLSGVYQKEESAPDRYWMNLLKEQLKKGEVGLSVDLGCARLSVKDFLNMKTGDILLLESGLRNKLVAKVEGIPKMHGHMGRLGNKKAFRVEEWRSPSPAQSQ
jgi:flagellar motor switch protein FliM